MDEGVRRAPVLIVVGVDGSQGSARALTWALREARDRRAAVRVVTAWAWDGAAGGTGGSGVSMARVARQNQEALVRAVLARFPGALPQLSAELVEGDPASALMERSRDGDLLVLGSRGLGSAAATAEVGSVADVCLRHGSCPVVVVPADAPIGAAEPAADGSRPGPAPSALDAVGLP